jgi:hypothetical protein
MRTNRRSALMDRHFVTHGSGALAALVILLPRVANAIGASAHARKVRAHCVPSKRHCGNRSRVRQFVTTGW